MPNQVSDLKITPKRLGLICVASFCPRCFWYMLKLRFKLPFNHFGGAIFNYLEQAQMAIIGHLLETKGRLPKDFHPFDDVVSRVEFPRCWQRFQYRLESGVLLYGVPDEIVGLEDGSNCILDHKSAHKKDGTDPLLPCYEIQGIGYGLIAERGLDLGPTLRGGLIYWASQHEAVKADPKSHYEPGQLWVGFVPQAHEYSMDYAVLDAPLKEAIKLWAAKTPPARSEGCKDCVRLDALMQLETEVQNTLALIDQKVLWGSGNDPWIVRRIQARHNEDSKMRRTAAAEVLSDRLVSDFQADGMIANWDYWE